MSKTGRNDPCPCGSGKQFRPCCQQTSLAPQRPTADGFATLDEALSAFASGQVPDYAGFRLWFQREWEKRRATGSLDAPPVDFPTQALERLAELAHPDHRHTLNSLQLKQLKLLLGLVIERERGRDFANALFNDNKFNILLNKATPAVLRFRLHKAIRDGQELDAMRVLGALERLDDLHDPGEIAFLGSLCMFKANRFSDALEWASRVDSDAIDSPKARQVELLSHSMLGDAARVRSLLESIGPSGLSPAQVQRAVMLLLCHADVSPDEQKTLQSLWYVCPL